jgi:murein DD-endopeptidase
MTMWPARLLIAGALLVAPACGAAPPASPQASPLEMSIPLAPTAVAIGGSSVLVYELHVTNTGTDSLRLRRLEVRGDDEARIAEFRGEDLRTMVATMADRGPDADPVVVAANATTVVFLELPLTADTAPAELVHRLEAEHAASAELHVEAAARVRVAGEVAPVLGPPLNGGPWAAVYHPQWARGHRRVFYEVDGVARIPGRFAIDYFRVDRDGRVARSDRDIVSDWLGYAADVLAVADGVVVAARNDVAESPRISTHVRLPLADGTGNYVALDIGGGRYAFYEHLRPGSVRVAAGQRVLRGDVIAQLGFTGHTSGPHLHFHLADANSPLGAEGMPFVIDRFHIIGTYDIDIGAFFQEPWTPSDNDATSTRTAERPPPNSVIMFQDPP